MAKEKKAKTKKAPAKKELKKHSAAIQIEGKITLLQRKTWNVLLWNAYDALPTQDIHHLPTLQAMRLVGYDSHDDEYFKASLESLAGCKVKWNILDKDGVPDWGFAVLLASASIKDGICSYGFAPHLRYKLHNPDMYARLDLDLQKRFESKHAIALWELCTDYLGSKREAGETPWIPLEDFRALMGIEKEEYARFNNLNLRVISPALAEVNRVSDFCVTVAYQHQGRKVTTLKFKMQRMARLPEPAKNQGTLFPDLDDMPAVVKALKDAGLSTQDAFEIWQQGFFYVTEDVRPSGSGEADFAQYIREKIHLLKHRQASGKVENPTGFLLEAIRKNYAHPAFGEAERAQARQAKARERTVLKEQRAAAIRRQDDRLHAQSLQIIEAAPQLLEEAMTVLQERNLVFRQQYQTDKTPLENYRARPYLWIETDKFLEQRDPASFQALRDAHHAELTALDARIAALEPFPAS